MAERYVVGRLNDLETEQFERHLIGCRDCQGAVRLGATIRDEVRSMPPTSSTRPAVPPRFVMLLGVAAAAGVAAIVGSRALDQRAIKRLGVVASAPAYEGIEVRSPARAESLFAEGMRLYSSGRFDDARRALSEARANGADSVPASFFIGVTELMARQPRRAVDDLAAVLRRGETPYAPEAHYYLAKAWLQLGRADSARAHLEIAATLGAPIAAGARALSDSLAEIRR